MLKSSLLIKQKRCVIIFLYTDDVFAKVPSECLIKELNHGLDGKLHQQTYFRIILCMYLCVSVWAQVCDGRHVTPDRSQKGPQAGSSTASHLLL